MRIICLIVLVGLLSACNGGQKNTAADSANHPAAMPDSIRAADSIKLVDTKKAFKPYKLNSDYTVIDTGEIYCGTWEGVYAIVKDKRGFADTIHLGVGMQEISPGQYMFLTFTKSNSKWETDRNVCPHQYVIASNGKNESLKSLFNGFNDYKSAPKVINGKIYFWQYIKQADNLFKVNAAVYNPQTGKIKSRYLFSGDLSDNEHIFPPFDKGGKIVFDWENHLWKFFPANFQLLK